MEVIRVRRVVNNDNVLHRPSQQGKIFDVAALVREAVISVEAVWDKTILVDGIHEWIRIDTHRGRVDHDLI